MSLYFSQSDREMGSQVLVVLFLLSDYSIYVPWEALTNLIPASCATGN